MAFQELQQRCQNNAAGIQGDHSYIQVYTYMGLRSSPAALSQVPSCITSTRLHASNPNLSTAVLSNDKIESESLHCAFDMTKLQEDFCRMASNCELF